MPKERQGGSAPVTNDCPQLPPATTPKKPIPFKKKKKKKWREQRVDMIFCMSDFYRVRIRILLDLGMVQTHLLPNSFKQQVLWVHTLHQWSRITSSSTLHVSYTTALPLATTSTLATVHSAGYEAVKSTSSLGIHENRYAGHVVAPR